MNVYFISGLGADKRAFYKIKLPGGFTPVFLDWIPPLQNESFTDYAKRFSTLIDTTETFILVGLSFGGMLASELSKFITPEKIIIISSLGCSDELPWYFKKAGKIGLHKKIPVSWFKKATIINRFMGAGEREMKQIVYDYVKKTDPGFIRWSLNAIITWDQKERCPNLVHIHGLKDHLLPKRFVKANYFVKNGGHLMVMNKAEEVNAILREILQQIISKE